MTGDPGILAARLNELFGLDLADFAEARAWLADGGWERFDVWLDRHRNDADDTAEETSNQ
jgi:hypothetical protein